MRGKYAIINVILLILLIWLIVFNIPAACWIAYDQISCMAKYEYAIDADITSDPYLELIGDEYEGNKEAGYQYYALYIPLHNTGTREISSSSSLYCRYEGEDYCDVEEYSSTNPNESHFIRYNNWVLPVGQEGVAKVILEIREGVSQIEAVSYDTEDDYYEEKNGVRYKVVVPQ